jgi:hypothetical protein
MGLERSSGQPEQVSWNWTQIGVEGGENDEQQEAWPRQDKDKKEKSRERERERETTYGAIDFVEEGRGERANDSHDEHGGSDAGGARVEPLFLALEGAADHGGTWEEEDACEEGADD